MKNIVIIFAVAVFATSCAKKNTPAETVQPVQQQSEPASKRPTGEKDVILNKSEVEVQQIEIDQNKMEQLRKSFEQQRLQKVDENAPGTQYPNKEKPMTIPPAGNKTIESERTKP
jgi:BioD-like phosphotransacetylase family protein